jgi:FSR family fosmidomycin resistance protein-like MFS transporter
MPAIGTATSIAAVVASHTFVDLVSGSIHALLPSIKDRFSLSSMQAAGLVATIAGSTSLSQPLVGRIADRIGARRVAAVGAVLSSSLLALVGLAPHLWLVVLLIVVGGLGSAGYHPASVVLARHVMPERAQLAVSLFAAGGMLGMAVGPIAILLIAAHSGLGFTPILMIPGVVLGVVLWRNVPDEPAITQTRRPGEAWQLLHGPVGSLAVAAGLAGLAATTFTAGMPMWIAQTGGDGNSVTIGLTLGLFQLGAALGGLGVGWTVARVAPPRLAFGALLLSAPLLLLVLALDPGTIGFLAATAAAGVLVSAASPLIIVAAQQRAPQSVAAASGIVMGLAGGAAGFAFIAIGALADAIGLKAALSVGFLASVPAALVARRALADRTKADSPRMLPGVTCSCLSCACAVTA